MYLLGWWWCFKFSRNFLHLVTITRTIWLGPHRHNIPRPRAPVLPIGFLIYHKFSLVFHSFINMLNRFIYIGYPIVSDVYLIGLPFLVIQVIRSMTTFWFRIRHRVLRFHFSATFLCLSELVKLMFSSWPSTISSTFMSSLFCCCTSCIGGGCCCCAACCCCCWICCSNGFGFGYSSLSDFSLLLVGSPILCPFAFISITCESSSIKLIY